MVRRCARIFRVASLAPVLVAFFVMSHGDDVPTQTPALPTHGVLEFGTLGGAATSRDLEEFGRHIVGQAQTAQGHPRDRGDRRGIHDCRNARRTGERRVRANGGTVVGQAQTATGATHAFSAGLWGPNTGTIADLGPLGGTWSAAYSARYGWNRRRLHARRRQPAPGLHDHQMDRWPRCRSTRRATASPRTSISIRWSATPAPPAMPRAAPSGSRRVYRRCCPRSVATARQMRSMAGNRLSVFFTTNPATKHAFLFTIPRRLPTSGRSAAEQRSVRYQRPRRRRRHVGCHRWWHSRLRLANGAMTDLNTLVPSGSGWLLQRATGDQRRRVRLSGSARSMGRPADSS